MTLEELLEAKTHVDAPDVSRRIMYTLTENVELPTSPSEVHAWRNTKMLALLGKHLSDKGLLSDDEIGELLLEAVR